MKKVTSYLLAMAFFFTLFAGVFQPVVFATESAATTATTTTAATAQVPANTKVAIHKIVMPEDALKAWDHDAKNAEYERATGKKYEGNQIENITQFFGAQAKEVAGVAFNVYEVSENLQEGFTKGDDASLASVKGLEAAKYYKKIGNDYVTTTNGIDVVLENGTVDAPKTYVIVENKEKSPYFKTPNSSNTEGGQELTLAKAIPMTLTLPLGKLDGTGFFSETDKLHVYPKNTEEKPTIEKALDYEDTKPTNFDKGEDIKYKVTTDILEGSTYKTLGWTDEMGAGLDYVKDSLTIQLLERPASAQGEQPQVERLEAVNFDTADYTLVETQKGFILELTASGLQKVETAVANADRKIEIKYKGVLNETALLDTNIPNKVKLDYGNRPRTNSTPKSGQPKSDSKKIKVAKTWADGLSPVEVKFDIFEKETGKFVETVTLGAQETEKENTTELDTQKEYIVVEQRKDGIVPAYESFTDGTVTIKNNKNENPRPLEPTPVNVKTHGKKFVKVDKLQQTTKLANAHFVVQNNAGNYLAVKTAAQKEQAYETYKTKEQEYQALVASATTTDPKTNEIANAKLARDNAYEAVELQWNWVDDKAQAFTFVSDDDGEFEVNGLKAGTYNLIETKAPKGYAILTTAVEFTVGQGTYGDTEELKQKVTNNKITIPQTGGMGTVLFTLVGLGLMAYALVSMRKTKKEDR